MTRFTIPMLMYYFEFEIAKEELKTFKVHFSADGNKFDMPFKLKIRNKA